jgi:hypothetical protein
MLYARLTGWLCAARLKHWITLIAFLCALPSLTIGFQSDDYILHQQTLERGPSAAYRFSARDPQLAREQALEARSDGRVPWWGDGRAYVRYFRPLSSLSLWLDFAHGAPAWWMHLENCAIYAAIVWLAIAIYEQLGLSGPGLGWAAVFFGLDGALAFSIGWIASRNTLLAAGFGLACVLAYVHARRTGRAVLHALACLCFSLSLLSGELGLCTLGYLCAHALAVDRAPHIRRVLSLSPYAALTGIYLVHYVTMGYGAKNLGITADVFGSPTAAAFALSAYVPIWLASTATFPFATFIMLLPNVFVPMLVLSIAILALLVPLLATRWTELPQARMLAAGAVLSLVPLVATLPQERLRFFVAFGVYGVLGPWVARDYSAPERMRRIVVRGLWAIHALWMPLQFIPQLFGCASLFGGGGASALDRVVPRSAPPITIVLNAPTPFVPWYQAAMRASRGEVRPPVFILYAGTQSLEVERYADRGLELHAEHSWLTEPFQSIRDLRRAPFRTGDQIALKHLRVEVRAVNAEGAPTRVRFTFDRSLDDPSLAFRCWAGPEIALWSPPPIGGRVQLTAAGLF